MKWFCGGGVLYFRIMRLFALSLLYTVRIVSSISRWRRQWHPTPVLLSGKSHRQRSLVGYSPWGHKESDMTERLHFHFSFSLEKEMHPTPVFLPGESQGEWAAISGVAQSRI